MQPLYHIPLPPKVKNIRGQQFGRLTALRYMGTRRLGKKQTQNGPKAMWMCLCECGRIVIVRASELRCGHNNSCGCTHTYAARPRTHGLRDCPEYGVWANMIQRCGNTHNPQFADYGGRGIVVCERWQTFMGFFEDMGSRPTPAHTVERVDNNAPYNATNCIWATRDIQSRNTRRTRLLTFDGRTMCLIDWARHIGIDRKTITGRLERGWSIQDALTIPPRAGGKTLADII